MQRRQSVPRSTDVLDGVQHPGRPAAQRRQSAARSVDVFNGARGFHGTVVHGDDSMSFLDKEYDPSKESSYDSSRRSSYFTTSVPPSSGASRPQSGIYDAYDAKSAGPPAGAIVVRDLTSLMPTPTATPFSSRAPTPSPYRIRPVSTTHYLIEKEGFIPIWIEKDPIPSPRSLWAGGSAIDNDKHGQPSSTRFSGREMLFVFNVCLAQLLSLAGLAQTFTPLVILSNAFGISDPGLMAWPTAAYSLTLGSCILPAGRLGDMYGHKKLFLIGWVWFAVSSVLCGFSDYGGFEMLTGCRALQGIGPALVVPNGLALLGRNFPIGVKRNLAISLFGGMGPVGVTLGVVFSAVFAQLVRWPWSFWAMGIAAALVPIMSYFVIPQDKISHGTLRRRFDFYGAATGVGGLVLINFALNQAPITGWKVPYIGIMLGTGIVLMAAFVFVELVIAHQPLIPLKGIKTDAALTLACIAAGWGSHGVWSYYMYLLIEQIRNHSPLAASLRTWPVAPIGFAAALFVGPLLKRKFKVAYLMSIAMLCFLLGCLLLATAPAEQGYFPNTFLSVVITPFGMNWSFPTGVILMSNAVHREHQGIAASLVSTMVNYSISTGLGFAGSIDRYISPLHGVLAGYRAAWYFGMGLAGLGFIISLYFIWQSRTRK